MREMTAMETRFRINDLMNQHDKLRAKWLTVKHKKIAEVIARKCFWLLRTIQLYDDHLEDLRTRDKPIKVMFD